MSDDDVRAALRSEASLVAVEAPAGCGKTYQGADYARDAMAVTSGRVLILTHTHAACSVFAERTTGVGSRVEIRTIDSIISAIATRYHAGLGLPPDPASWARQRKNGHAELAVKVAMLLKRYEMISDSLARRYPTVICDEHQDSSGDQHALAMSLHKHGARVRLFADPMQKIFREKRLPGASSPYDWDSLVADADLAVELEYPHRWDRGCHQLGQWTLAARTALKTGGLVDLRTRPSSVHVVYARNRAQRNLDYRLSSAERKPIDAVEARSSSLLILTRHNETARAFRSFFNRRIPLWEGHTRPGLEALVEVLSSESKSTTAAAIASAIVSFMGEVGKGFSPSAFGNRFEQEVLEDCRKCARGKFAAIQSLARLILLEPDHRGASKMLRRLAELCEEDAAFRDVKIDCNKEFWEATRLGDFETAEAGLTEITHRRTYTRPKPPARAISTIHKSKGLECDSVILMPCNAATFPDTPEARCLLYVALSRAKSELLLVCSPDSPSPLLRL